MRNRKSGDAMADDGGVSHATLANMMTQGFAEQRESVRRVYQRCDALSDEMAALRVEQARIAEHGSHMAVGIDRVEQVLGERIDAVQADSLSWRRVFSDAGKLAIKTLPILGPALIGLGILRGWFASIPWPWTGPG